MRRMKPVRPADLVEFGRSRGQTDGVTRRSILLGGRRLIAALAGPPPPAYAAGIEAQSLRGHDLSRRSRRAGRRG